MNRTALLTTEKKHELPILIVDRQGTIGELLAKQLKNESLIVLVSKKTPEEINNVVHVPFLKKIPTIPDNTYSHIFLIDENLETTKNVLESFIKKASADNSSFVFVVGKKSVNQEFIDNLLVSYDKAKAVILGDIFAQNFLYDEESYINKFIREVALKGRIIVPGDGTKETSPVFLEDAINGILETAFGQDFEYKTYYLFPKYNITLISLAHIFQKLEPNILIDFTKDIKKNDDSVLNLSEGKYLLPNPYNLEERIKKIKLEETKIVEPTKNLNNVSKKKSSFSFTAIVFAFLLFLLLPLISTLLFSFIGVNSLYSVKNSLESGNLSSSKTLALFASKSFNIALASSQVLLVESTPIGQEKKVEDLTNKINAGNEIAGALVSLVDASNKITSVSSQTSKDPNSDFSQATAEIKNALYVYDKQSETGLIPKDTVAKLADSINLASSTIDFWPDILGFKGQKTYLILFQNNMELRPGGGFIGSYALLTVNKGKVANFKVYDVYDADGQLKGHVEPPFAIRRYLPSVHWYLRDSNFDVDNSKNAVAAAVFLNTEMHQQVDGVIDVDLSFVRNLLSVLGSVNVTDYNQTVNSDNFFQVTQTHAEKDFFPGSTQKKDFLTSFYNSFQQKIATTKNLSYISLLQAFATSIYEKHMLFAFNNVDEQAAFSINGWSSSLIDQRIDSPGAINDFMGISEANLGVDKVNYYVTRSLAQDVTINKSGQVSEDLTIAFKNTATSGVWTGAGYKNYLRVILPINTKITNISIDDINQKIVSAIEDPTVYEKKGFVPPTGLEVEQTNEAKNTLFGFLINVGPGELRTIKVSYVLPNTIDLTQPQINYSLKIFKQPGIDFYPYAMSVSFPDFLKETLGTSGVVLTDQKVVYSSQVLRDTTVNLQLSQK